MINPSAKDFIVETMDEISALMPNIQAPREAEARDAYIRLKDKVRRWEESKNFDASGFLNY